MTKRRSAESGSCHPAGTRLATQDRTVSTGPRRRPSPPRAKLMLARQDRGRDPERRLDQSGRWKGALRRVRKRLDRRASDLRPRRSCCTATCYAVISTPRLRPRPSARSKSHRYASGVRNFSTTASVKSQRQGVPAAQGGLRHGGRRWRAQAQPVPIKGAGQEESAERPVLTMAQVYAVAQAAGQRYQALILLAMFTSLRWGELAGLRRCDLDVDAKTVRVTRQLTEVNGRGIEFGPPKSKAGLRTVPIPALIIPCIRWHLNCFAQDGDEGLVFTSPRGLPLRHSQFRQRVWLPALKAAGLTNIHFHDLRHTGNTFAANNSKCASLRAAMDRMGHDSERAAMIYLHGSDKRQQAIADTLDKLARAELKRAGTRKTGLPTTNPTGTQRARKRPKAS